MPETQRSQNDSQRPPTIAGTGQRTPQRKGDWLESGRFVPVPFSCFGLRSGRSVPVPFSRTRQPAGSPQAGPTGRHPRPGGRRPQLVRLRRRPAFQRLHLRRLQRRRQNGRGLGAGQRTGLRPGLGRRGRDPQRHAGRPRRRRPAAAHAPPPDGAAAAGKSSSSTKPTV